MISDLYRDKLQTILNDELLLKALREVFDQTIENSKPLITERDDNSLLGEKYRAYLMAKEIVERGFTELNSYRIDRQKEKKFNKFK